MKQLKRPKSIPLDKWEHGSVGLPIMVISYFIIIGFFSNDYDWACVLVTASSNILWEQINKNKPGKFFDWMDVFAGVAMPTILFYLPMKVITSFL